MQVKNQRRTNRSAVLLLLIICITGFTSGAFAQNTDGQVFLLRDGVVVNGPRNELYITTPQNMVQAVAITTGEPLWTSAREGRPLAVINGRLVSQAWATGRENEVIVMQLDLTRKGAIISESSARLPGNVKAAFRHTPNVSFIMHPRVINGTPYILWEYRAQPLRGMADENQDRQDTGMVSESGAFTIDRNSGRINAINKEQLPASFYQQPALTDLKRLHPQQRQFVSMDGQHVMTSRKVAGDSVFNNYRWEIFERSSNRKIGEIMDYRSYTPFYVNNTIIIYDIGPYARAENGELRQTPLQIRAVDLGNARQLWSREILDTVNRTSTPPGMDN